MWRVVRTWRAASRRLHRRRGEPAAPASTAAPAAIDDRADAPPAPTADARDNQDVSGVARDVLLHVEALEVILGAQDAAQKAATAAAGGPVVSTETASGSTRTRITGPDVTLNNEQLVQIRAHLKDIRRLPNESSRPGTATLLPCYAPIFRRSIAGMTRALATTALLSIALLAPVSGTPTGASSDTPLQIADLAWERGDYPAALAAYLRLLDSPDAASVLEPIALRTGELYATTELTRDGALPQFSPDGRYLLYETGPVATRVIRVIATAAPDRVVVELRGGGAAFAPDSRKVAYWKPMAPATPDPPASTAPSAQGATVAARATIHALDTGQETSLDTGTLSAASLAIGAGNTVIFAAGPATPGPTQIHAVGSGRPLTALTADPTEKLLGAINATGTALIFTTRVPGAGRGGRGGPAAGGAQATGGDVAAPGAAPAVTVAPASGRGTAAPAAPPSFSVLSIPDGRIVTRAGSSPAFSPDGGTIVFVQRTAEETSLLAVATAEPAAAPVVVRKGPERLDFPAVSPSGSRIAFQMMTRDDWEIVVVNRDGSGETRVTRDIQHDLLPQFLSETSAAGRHRRGAASPLVPLRPRSRFAHAPLPQQHRPHDRARICLEAERRRKPAAHRRRARWRHRLPRARCLPDRPDAHRDASGRARARRRKPRGGGSAPREGDAALRANRGGDQDDDRRGVRQQHLRLREGPLRLRFEAHHAARQQARVGVSLRYLQIVRLHPGVPVVRPCQRARGQTANVVATLKGTVNPELIYVVSSHYDSVAIGPGADDDSSGTAALLETARIMAQRPQPATIVFASFTGEEAGLLGSREFVRRAVADKLHIVGALNNDMVGWANDERLDNTIRYSNPGIRDIQHAAAIQFSNLITYDALYYKGTDAAAYYEAFGDIVGGIGSYPVLSSPHYHQSHDVLDEHQPSVGHRSRQDDGGDADAAGVEPLADDGSERGPQGSTATVSWKPSPERGVNAYVVSYGPPAKPDEHQMRVTEAERSSLSNIAPGTIVAVKAVNAKGFEGWDWARVTVK